MSGTPYTPVAVKLPTTITEPVDGEPRVSASVTQLTRPIADGVKYLADNIASFFHSDEFLASGTWTCPAGVTSAEIEYWGAGGAGGFGCDGQVGTDQWALPGAGGGAALRQTRRVTVIPATVYDVTIGAAGTAGARPATPATDGGDTVFAIHLGATIATGSGARAGASVSDSTLDIDGSSTTDFPHTLGGGPVRGNPVTGFTDLISYETGSSSGVTFQTYAHNAPGHGGDGHTLKGTPRAGQRSLEGFAGGAAGTRGTSASGAMGGGAGGGGAAGPGGAGGAGGNGGNGATGGGGGGNATASTAGTAPAANSGAGGGGGGGGGCTAGGTPSHGSAGAASGSGYFKITYLKVA